MQKLDSGLVCHLKFDETTGTVADDSSGKKNEANLQNNPQWVPGKFGNALLFDGKDDVVVIPSSDSMNKLNENNFTLSVWFKPEVMPVGSGPI